MAVLTGVSGYSPFSWFHGITTVTVPAFIHPLPTALLRRPPVGTHSATTSAGSSPGVALLDPPVTEAAK